MCLQQCILSLTTLHSRSVPLTYFNSPCKVKPKLSKVCHLDILMYKEIITLSACLKNIFVCFYQVRKCAITRYFNETGGYLNTHVPGSQNEAVDKHIPGFSSYRN